jgi:hypothetical protein
MMAIGVTAPPARADAPRDQGWWTVTNPSVPGAPVAAPVAVPGPPDVPAKGLLIQAGPGGAPIAFAAVLYELGPGTSVGNLTLGVAPNSLTTPMATLQLCPLLQPINHPEQGGPMTDAPPFNCGKKVTAAPSADGKTYQFNAAGLVTDNVVAVAILPAGPVDRVVLSAPDANSLTTQQTSGDTTTPPADTGTAVGPPELGSPGSGLLDSPPIATPPGVDTALPGASTGAPSVASPARPKAAGGRSNVGGAFVPVVSSSPETATPLLVILFVAGGLGGAALWLFAGRHRGDAAVSR